MRINRNNGNKSLQGLKTRTGLDHKGQDTDKDLTPGPGQGQGPDPKDQDKDKDLKNVLKESLRTRTRINIPEGDRQRLEHLIARMRRSGYLPSDFPDLATLVEEADCNLYKNIQRNNKHVLRQYFIEKPAPTRQLRVRAHNFVLSPRDNSNFILKVLCKALGLSNG